MKVRLTPRALRDLHHVSATIRASNPAAARRVQAAIRHAIALLAVHPFAGRSFDGGRRRFALARFPYLIFYRVNDGAQVVEIITIRHAARSPEAD